MPLSESTAQIGHSSGDPNARSRGQPDHPVRHLNPDRQGRTVSQVAAALAFNTVFVQGSKPQLYARQPDHAILTAVLKLSTEYRRKIRYNFGTLERAEISLIFV
jgi:hypothetical protein